MFSKCFPNVFQFIINFAFGHNKQTIWLHSN
nr:MAG TPA: hypothetical protein [Caudoviricetes sp.]